MGIQFHETQMGARFFNRQLPDLINAVNRLADAMEASTAVSCPEHKTTVGTDDPSEKDMSTINNVPKQSKPDNPDYNPNNYIPKTKIKLTNTSVQSPCVNCTSKECGFIDGNECDRFNAWYKRKKELEAASPLTMVDLLNYFLGEIK